MRGTLDLAFPSRAYLRLVGSAFLFTLLLYGVGRGVARTYRSAHQRESGEFLELPSWLAGAHPHPFQVLFSPMTFTFLIMAAIACGLLWLRQPRGARITWDPEGITEWDGEGVRTAIRWSDARRSQLSVVVKRKGGGTYHGGSVEQISDDEGRRITRSMSSWTTPIFLYRRRAECAETAIHAPTREGDGIVPDAATRHPRWTVWPLRGGYAAAAFAAFVMQELRHDPVGDAALLAFVAVLLGLRIIRPMLELRQIAAEERTYADAVPVELVGSEEGLVQVRDAQGRDAAFDPAPLHHDDALLHTRRGAAFMVFTPPVEAAGGYRGGRTLLEVQAVELAGDRLARRDLRRAVRLEVATRLLIPVAFLGAGLLLLSVS